MRRDGGGGGARRTEVLANVVASQMTTHAQYGGVVPELASREHLRNIVPVVRAAMAEAGVGFGELDAIAVTEGPGLAGALLVGITYAKALASGLGKPLIGVNHLEGHIHAVLLERERKRLRRSARARRRSFSALGAGAVLDCGSYAPVHSAAAGRGCGVSECGADGGRCGGRGVRQGGEAAGAGVSGRAVD